MKNSLRPTTLIRRLLTSASVVAFCTLTASSAFADDFINALKSAYETNPRLKAQREVLKATDENVAVAVSGWRPTIGANYSDGRERSQFGNAAREYGDTKSKTLTFEQPLFSFGETWSRVKSAKNSVKAGQQQLRDFEQSVLIDAVTAYMDVVQNTAVLDLSRKNVGVLKKQLKASNDRFEVGEVTRTDVAQSEARLSAAESETIQAEGALASARATFKRVIGYEAPANLPLPKNLAGLPASLAEALKLAEAQNPSLLASDHLTKAADNDVDANLANLLPDVSLQGRMNREEGSGSTGGSDFDSDSILLNVRIPLYQSGSEYSAIRRSKDVLAQRKFERANAKDATIEAVTSAWEEHQAAKGTIKSRQDAIDAAEIALDGVKQEQQYGARTTLDVLDAEQELFIAKVNLVRAQRNEVVAAHNLLASFGKMTAQDIKLQAEIYNPDEHYDNVKYKFIGF